MSGDELEFPKNKMKKSFTAILILCTLHTRNIPETLCLDFSQLLNHRDSLSYFRPLANLSREKRLFSSLRRKVYRKKKALQSLKAPQKEPEPLIPLKRHMEAKDAKEMAKKLIKSGAIRVPGRSVASGDKTTFKRSMGLERKLSAADKAPSGYQPFSTTHPEEEIHESRVKVKENLYESFVSARDREERGDLNREGKTSDGKPRQGHTIYVFGYNISEEILKKAFSTFGNIVNVNMEIEKNCGFVTFDKVDSAEKAIAEMHGSMVSGIQLKVSLARRQPVIDPINDASSSATWSTIAASNPK
ncbi:unnamed protein product, partial [Meganyctiphanes norvegica]